MHPIAGAEVALTMLYDPVRAACIVPLIAPPSPRSLLGIRRHVIGAAAGGPSFVAVIPERHLVLIAVQDCTKTCPVRRGGWALARHWPGDRMLQRNAHGQPAMRTRSMDFVVIMEARSRIVPQVSERTQNPMRLPQVAPVLVGRTLPQEPLRQTKLHLKDSIDIGTDRNDSLPLTAVRSGRLLDRYR